jgi:hypothetical protein
VIEDLDSSVAFRSYRIAREYALHMLRNAMNSPRDIGGFLVEIILYMVPKTPHVTIYMVTTRIVGMHLPPKASLATLLGV